MLVPFGVGVAIPIAIFMITYARSDALPALAKGVFVLPAKRLTSATASNPGLLVTIAMLPLVALLTAAMYSRTPVRWPGNALVALGLSIVLVASAKYPVVYKFAWYALVMLIPLTVLAGAVLLKDWSGGGGLLFFRQQQVMLLLCVTGMCNLVQFPFHAPIYFCYVAPLLALAMLAVLSTRERLPRFLLASLLVFYLLFAVLRVTPGFIYDMGIRFMPDRESRRLTLARAGGLRVEPSMAGEYERLVPEVRKHAAGGFMYAAPDCPEVYFLSGLRNPTPTLFDFLDDPAGRTERILNALEKHQVKVIAIFGKPAFSPPLAPDLRRVLAERFPESTTVGRFEVRWRP
jgi:hypothetical protein